MGYVAPVEPYAGTPHGTQLSAGSGRLLDLYGQYFDIILAESPEQIRECLRLRYQVYCIENPFEDPLQNPGSIESDEFDSASMHALLRHRESGEMVGTVRLVLPRDGKEGMGLPIRQICQYEPISRVEI